MNNGNSEVRLSASQIKKYQRCPRQWAYRYIEKRPEPSSKSAELGSEVHNILESYLLHGAEFPSTKAGNIAKSGIHIVGPLKELYAGESGDGIQVEKEFQFPLYGATIRGFIDLAITDEPVVIDHKTSSNPQKYGLTPETLADDVQALMYAYAKLYVEGMTYELGEPVPTLAEYRDSLWTAYPVVELRWIYYSTRRAAPAYEVKAIMTREEIESKTRSLRPVIEEMVETKLKVLEAEKVRGNVEACGDFGGCPHASVCSIGKDPMQQMSLAWNETTEKEKEKKMGLKELAAQRRAQATGTSAPARDLNPPEAPASVVEELRSSEERFQNISGSTQTSLPSQETPKPAKAAKKKKPAKNSLEKELRELWTAVAISRGVEAAEEAVDVFYARFGG